MFCCGDHVVAGALQGRQGVARAAGEDHQGHLRSAAMHFIIVFDAIYYYVVVYVVVFIRICISFITTICSQRRGGRPSGVPFLVCFLLCYFLCVISVFVFFIWFLF